MNSGSDLMRSLITSIFLLVVSCSVQGQLYRVGKTLRKNKKAPFLSVQDETVYARGILSEKNRIITGNSDGSIYLTNVENNSNQLLFRINDFHETRDIERSGSFLMGLQSGDNGRIVRMHDNGRTKIIEVDGEDSVFLDGMDFFHSIGFIMGDPVDGTFSLYHSLDAGNSWSKCEGGIQAVKGEAGFAASGTNVQVLNDSTYVFVSGGLKSRFFKSTDNGKSWSDVLLPFYPGESSGAFSVSFLDDSIGVIVGGDYQSFNLKLNTCYYTTDGGASWFNSVTPPNGYRACVIEKNGVFYSSGRNGIDVSFDNGVNWLPFMEGTFFSLAASETNLFATTREGKIQVFDLVNTQ